jgi:PhoPQ-activated pathogenicity-related protein
LENRLVLAPVADIIDITPDPRATFVDVVIVTFDQPVTGVDINDFRLTRDGTNIPLGTLPIGEATPSQYALNLGTVTNLSGTYVLTLVASGSNIRDTLGQLLTTNASDTWVVDRTPPGGAIVSPLPDFTNQPVEFIDVEFDEPIVESTFDHLDLVLRRDGGGNLITSDVQVAHVDGRTYRVSGLSSLTNEAGVYTFSVVLNGISDPLGNFGTGTVADNWTSDFVGPLVDVGTAIASPIRTSVPSIDLVFTEPLQAGSLDLADLSLTRDGGANLLDGSVSISQVSPTLYRVNGLSTLTSAAGNYRFGVNAAGVVDRASNAGTNSAEVTWDVDLTPPQLISLSPVTPDPRTAAVLSLTVEFSEPIDLATFTGADLSLTRNGGSNLIPSAVSIQHVTGNRYEVVIGNLTTNAGSYSFTIQAAGIQDLAGHAASGELTESWELTAAVLQNPVVHEDVDNDGFVLPLDALLIINWINTKGNDAPLPTSSPPFLDVDGDGHIVPTDVNIIFTALNSDTSGPEVALLLQNDTAAGGVNTDRISSDPTLTGLVTDLSQLHSAQIVSMNGRPVNFDLLPHMSNLGGFVLDMATLQAINGTALVDGNISLQVRALDVFGHSNTTSFSFTLDRLAQQPLLPDMLESSDSGQSNADNITNVAGPQLSISSELGELTIFVDSIAILTLPGGANVMVNLPPLADGVHSITARLTDLAGNVSNVSSALSLTVKTTPPQLELVILPVIDDLTPRVQIKQPAARDIPDGSLVTVDVDLNFDGDYDDPGELDFGSSTFYQGAADFTLTRALAPSDPGVGAYHVSMRARTTDIAGNVGISLSTGTAVDTLSNDVLREYVYRDDGAYTYSLNTTLNGGSYTAYIIDMTSQIWRSPGEVNRTVWQHWLTIIVPSASFGPLRSTAGLVITGSNNSGSPPTELDDETEIAAQLAVATRSVIAVLRNTPNQPLFFPDEFPVRGRTEDDLIAYTYDKFLETGDTDWPLLLPMVKGAVKAMDTVQSFVPAIRSGAEIDDFMVTGASKRGWTTWLTAAVDDRVSSIIPMVFDALNLDEQMVNHYGAYGFFSQAIYPYNEMEIFQRILTAQGRELGRIVDPYTYIAQGRYNIPILSINSTGDEFFFSDSSQFYIHDLPGPTYLRYIPNSGHGLGLEEGSMSAPQSIATFYWAQLTGETLPTYSWEVMPDQSIRVQTSTTGLVGVRVWQATNPVTRDFRNLLWDLTWTSTALSPTSPGVYTAAVPIPVSGATAFMIELEYSSSFPQLLGLPFASRHIFTTDVVIRTNMPEHAWPYPIDPFPLALASIDSSSSLPLLAPFTTTIESQAMGLATQLQPPPEALEWTPLTEWPWVSPEQAGPVIDSLEDSVDELLGSEDSLETILMGL